MSEALGLMSTVVLSIAIVLLSMAIGRVSTSLGEARRSVQRLEERVDNLLRLQNLPLSTGIQSSSTQSSKVTVSAEEINDAVKSIREAGAFGPGSKTWMGGRP